MNTANRNPVGDEVVVMVKDARKAYYVGDYDIALKLITQVLAKESDYDDAKRVLAQIESSIRSGEIPVAKIPEQSRIEYNKALSLERAGRFDDAKKGYLEAQKILIDSLQNGEKKIWPIAFDAIQRMDRYLLADKLCVESEKLAADDKWEEAIISYSNALSEYGDNYKASIVKRSIEELQETQTRYIEIHNALSERPTIDLLESTRKLSSALQVVSSQASRFPESKKWRRLERELQKKIQDARKSLLDRKKLLVENVSNADTIVQAKIQVDELLKLLRLATETWDDEDFHQLLLHYDARSKIINGHWSDFQTATQALLSSEKSDDSLRKIQLTLMSLQSYSMDLEYTQSIHLLKSQIISRSKEYLDTRQTQKAKKLLGLLEEEPFNLIDDRNNSSQFLKWLELQVSRNRGDDDLYRWYQIQKINYETGELYENTKTHFLNAINRLFSHSQIWFIASISAALVFSGILAYAILVTINKNNPLTLILPILSPVVPLYVTKLLYDQSVAVNDRMRDTRKEMDDRLNDILDKRRQALEELDEKNGTQIE